MSTTISVDIAWERLLLSNTLLIDLVLVVVQLLLFGVLAAWGQQVQKFIGSVRMVWSRT